MELYLNYNLYLAHNGVKGMKWGVRKKFYYAKSLGQHLIGSQVAQTTTQNATKYMLNGRHKNRLGGTIARGIGATYGYGVNYGLYFRNKSKILKDKSLSPDQKRYLLRVEKKINVISNTLVNVHSMYPAIKRGIKIIRPIIQTLYGRGISGAYLRYQNKR